MRGDTWEERHRDAAEFRKRYTEKQSLGPFSSTYAKPRSPNMNSRSKSRHSTSVALSRIGPSFLNREARSLLIYDLAILWISSRESESRWYGGCVPVVGETYNAPVFPTLDRRGDPSNHQPWVSSSILLIVSLTESKENRYFCAFQDFHGIAIHDDQYEVFSRHPGAPGRHARFVRTTIGVSNCENRIYALASITLNIVANMFRKFEDDTHMRIDRPGLLRRTVNVGGGLSTRKYNRRSCTVDQARCEYYCPRDSLTQGFKTRSLRRHIYEQHDKCLLLIRFNKNV
ncbi:hypothetical protein ALC62_10415 [Cyphomyrmex costatus]|uniref:Uncharacterized protein n=1 Tax=Cyphomyrmex costatus TaxID=456900 RepID=A0A151IDS4_9HYME|nr:hypothetical protein ALC62_10415 [Cyphomyrmex costatus]